MRPPPPPRNSKTKSQRSEPKWLLKYLITPNFCAKFYPNWLTTTFGPWNTFSDNDTLKRKDVICKRIKYGPSKLILLESIKTNTVCKTHC